MSNNQSLSTDVQLLKQQVAELFRLVQQLNSEATTSASTASAYNCDTNSGHEIKVEQDFKVDEAVRAVFYSGQYEVQGQPFRWLPQKRNTDDLLGLNSEKVSKVLTALAHKQRLDILRALLGQALTGAELVEQLNMGTTGQLYHHLKALLSSDLIVQQGGRYTVPNHRTFPLLVLLAAVSDLLDTSKYMDMAEARQQVATYLGAAEENHDPHLLLWAVVENVVLEHRAGHSSAVGLFLHDDGSVTVSDNGRGIPTQVLPHTNEPAVQSILTDIRRFEADAPYMAHGAEKGISIAVVNALSYRLTIEIRRDGRIYRQTYKYGVPETGLMTVGLTNESGTSVTFKPNPELFSTEFKRDILEEKAAQLAASYPELTITVQH
ncbi:ATP-binding protein [Paenibacillus sp. 481]|uniref:ATP-binding protein n=1 Tax=Paenibacillus sp. 481 TaxID=2835869 RepID=UPI001E2D6869|nr:ATP-binding protein [Paenibacillus sp. 481]UHA71827.1 helix-turn-helix domain-containing protein [Paenibacillus sp. 481]